MRYVDLGKSVSSRENNNNVPITTLSGNVASAKKSSGYGYLKYIIIFFVLGLVGGLFLFFGKGAGALFDPVSVVSTIASADLNETDGRTNVLILGSDKRTDGSVVTSELTDTILVASIGRVEGNVVLISLPRDLWVTAPSGGKSKINAVYAFGGAEELQAVVEDVLGIPIHYYAVVDFNLFQDSIDILGGIDVNVERTFDDFYYPIEGKETAPENERYETVHFDAGLQNMNGEMALKYVRSRKGTNGEGTDFARSRRQQNVIMAIKNKALSLETLVDLPKLKELYDTYSTYVDTNIDFATAQSFYLLSQKINFESIRTVVLDDRSAADEGGLLFHPTDTSLYGGAYVLIPRAGDYSQLHAYVQRYVFGN